MRERDPLKDYRKSSQVQLGRAVGMREEAVLGVAGIVPRHKVRHMTARALERADSLDAPPPAWAHADESRAAAWSMDVYKHGDLTETIDLSHQSRFLCGRTDGSERVDIDLGDGAGVRSTVAPWTLVRQE